MDKKTATLTDTLVIDRRTYEKNPSFGKICSVCGTLELSGVEIRRGNYQIEPLLQMGIEVTHGILSKDCIKRFYGNKMDDIVGSLKLKEYCRNTPRI